MQLMVNGESFSWDGALTLARLLALWGVSLERAGIAVAVDGTLVVREEWSMRHLRGGECVEIITAVPGG